MALRFMNILRAICNLWNLEVDFASIFHELCTQILTAGRDGRDVYKNLEANSHIKLDVFCGGLKHYFDRKSDR